MGIKQDIETSLKDYSFTKIDGQPSDEDVTNLVREMTEMLASVPTTNGGGSHGHIGMIIEDAEYRTFSTGNQPFVVPTNPGPYPTTVDPDPATRERQVAEHKAEKEEFDTYLGVLNAARQHVIRAVDPEWLEAIRSPTLGFAHLTLRDIIDHLRDAGGDLDYMDVADLIAELTKPWEVSEHPATKFARDDKYERQLIKAGLPDQQALRLSLAQSSFKATGEYDAQLREFDARPVADRTFTKFRTFIVTEYAKRSKGRSTAKSVGFGIANSATTTTPTAEEQAEETAWAIAELANALTTNQKKEFEQLTTMFSQLMQKLGTNPNPTPNPHPNQRNGTQGGGGTQPRVPCVHCGCKHGRPDAQCWELEANKASRPATWKPIAERRANKTK